MAKWKRKFSLPRRWQRNHLISKYGNTCVVCGEPFERLDEITIDHWIPLGRGGEDVIANYRLAHLDCNWTKADMTPEGFQDFQKGRIQWEAA